MKTIRRAAAALAVALALTLSAAPAMAASKSGSTSCAGGATLSVRGEQQRVTDLLGLYTQGQLRWSNTGYYTKTYVSNAKNGSWEAYSATLLLSGSYGYCSGPW